MNGLSMAWKKKENEKLHDASSDLKSGHAFVDVPPVILFEFHPIYLGSKLPL
jgi:hypothetical protein